MGLERDELLTGGALEHCKMQQEPVAVSSHAYGHYPKRAILFEGVYRWHVS